MAGAKGSDDLSHSFVELYNASSSPVDLTGYAIQYQEGKAGAKDKTDWVKLDLAGSIPANGYYLIRGKEENLQNTYVIPEGDIEWDQTFSNKGFSVALTDDNVVLSGTGDSTQWGNAHVIDLVGAGSNDFGKGDAGTEDEIPLSYEKEFSGLVSKKKAAVRKAHQDTDDNKADFETVDYSKDVSEALLVRNAKGETAKKASEIQPEGTYRTNGFDNETAALAIDELARYDSKTPNADGGSEEIVAYDAQNQTSYTVNGVLGVLSVVRFADKNIETPKEGLIEQTGTGLSVKDLVKDLDKDFAYGDMTSVAVSPDGTKVAVALQDADYSKPGRIALFDAKADGTLETPVLYETGVQPDCIKFSPDGKHVLTADEGEPRNGYGTDSVDPKGSVTVLDVAAKKAKVVGFDAWDAKRDDLVKGSVILKKDAKPSTDLEPEYVAIVGDTAYVTLQENNAIATLPLAKDGFTAIQSAGFEDYSKTPIDIDDSDKTMAQTTYDNLLGARMPDGIAGATIGGKTYLFTANEGDAREWGDYSTEKKTDLTSADKKVTAKKVRTVDTETQDGLDPKKTYLFGGRSFTAYEATDSGLTEVYDSQSEFEAKTFGFLPAFYNVSNDDLKLESRTAKKGVEAESVTTGTIGDKTYAFIGLERIGGIMVYDVTDPSKAVYVNYVNSRDFSKEIAGDDSPEGLQFVPEADSPFRKPLILGAFEVSGTMGTFGLTQAK